MGASPSSISHAHDSCLHARRKRRVLGTQDETLYSADLWGNTQLHKAVAKGNLEAAVGLIQLARRQGGQAKLLNARNAKGYTALHTAVSSSLPTATAVEFVRLLQREGADPWHRDRCGARTPLHLACLMGATECVNELLKEPAADGLRYVDAPGISGFTAIHYAIMGGRMATIEAVLQDSPNIFASNQHEAWEFSLVCNVHSTAMHLAALKGQPRIILALLKYYAERMDARVMPDPRLLADSKRLKPYQVAATKHYGAEVLNLLHPSTDVRSLFLPESLQPVGVPTLASLAATVLRGTMLKSLAPATATLAVPADAGEQARSGSGQEQQHCHTHHAGSGSCGAACAGSSSQVPLPSCQHAAGAPSPCCNGHSCCAGSTALPSPPAGAHSQCSGDAADDDDDVCDVCFEHAADVQLVGCVHRLCGGCCKELAERITDRPATCPFCRGAIRGFARA